MRIVMFTILTLVAIFSVAEIYFRFFSNYNEPVFDNKTGIIKRKSGREGIYMAGSRETGYFKINNEGWNSFRDYHKKKTTGKIRVAVVGHSNVEGLRVHVDKTLSKILEDDLNVNGINAEVYTFGFGGMHLAQALYVSRFVAKEYKPDILLVGTFLDDFIYEITEKKYFLSLKAGHNGKIEEMAPERSAINDQYNSPLSFFYFSKAFKYIDLKLDLGGKIFKRQQGLTTDSIYDQKKLLATNYIIKEFKKIVDNNCIQIMFIDFPISFPSNNKPDCFEPNHCDFKLNETKKILQKYSLPLIDIESALQKDYNKNEVKFDFIDDMHYNEHAHQVIGKALSITIIAKE